MIDSLLIPRMDDAAERGVQPLDEDQRAFVTSIYALFEDFKAGNVQYLRDIHLARDVRRLEDKELDRGIKNPLERTPQLNTLNSTIDNMVADYMDNQPEAVMIPETPEMSEAADDMTDVLGWVLQQARFKTAWRRVIEDATTTGTGILHVFWDDELNYGAQQGGVNIMVWQPESWLPDPLCNDMQDGRAVFKVCAYPMSYYIQHYPDQAPYISPDAHNILEPQAWTRDVQQQEADPLVALLEVWYKRYDAATKRYSVHMAKVAGNALLYDSREESPGGVYAHGKYPFIPLRFRERNNSAYGIGMVYEFADTQRMVNRYVRYVDANVRASAKPKLLINRNAGLDVDAVTDFERTVAEGDSIDPSALQWFQTRPINSQAMQMIQWLQDTEKQDSGQNQFSRGEGGLGVTAASAISMLQEAGGKITRLHTSAYMDSFHDMIEQIISIVAEYVTEEQIIMVSGREENAPRRGVAFQGKLLTGGKEAFERPAVSVRIETQRRNPQQVSSFNQLVMQMAEISAQSGVPIPANVLMRLLRVPGKDEIVKVLDEVDQTRQQMMQLQQTVEQLAAENDQLKDLAQRSGEELQAQKAMLDQVAARPAPMRKPSPGQIGAPQSGMNYGSMTSQMAEQGSA